MKLKCCTFGMIALLGMGTLPVAAKPVEVAVDDAVVVGGEQDALAEWTLETTVGLDFSSKQVTYGLIDNPHGILTPSFELAWQHEEGLRLAIGVEALFDTTNFGAKEGGYNNRRWKMQELDPYITLSKTWDTEEALGGALVTELGYVYEYHPRSCKKPTQEWSNPDTQWLNLSIGLEDDFLNPTFTVEYQLARQGAEGDTDGKGGLYATFEISHTFDIGAQMGMEDGVLCLTPGAGIGVANKHRNRADFEQDDAFMFRDAFASLELAYAPVDGLTIAPYIACHQQLDSAAKEAVGDDDFVAYAGIGIAYTF